MTDDFIQITMFFERVRKISEEVPFSGAKMIAQTFGI